MKKRNKILLGVGVAGFILFRLPISVILIKLFSMTSGIANVSPDIVATNVVLSKCLLDLLVFGYLGYKVKIYSYEKIEDNVNQDVPIMIFVMLSISYIIFDCIQAYNIII